MPRQSFYLAETRLMWYGIHDANQKQNFQTVLKIELNFNMVLLYATIDVHFQKMCFVKRTCYCSSTELVYFPMPFLNGYHHLHVALSPFSAPAHGDYFLLECCSPSFVHYIVTTQWIKTVVISAFSLQEAFKPLPLSGGGLRRGKRCHRAEARAVSWV